MRQAVADYLCGREDGKRKLHWRSWDWLSTPKKLGGLGFCDFPLFNQATLGRQCWRLLTKPDSLCARVLKGRYFPTVDFMHATVPNNSSATWRGIIAGRKALEAGIIKRICDGPLLMFALTAGCLGNFPCVRQFRLVMIPSTQFQT